MKMAVTKKYLNTVFKLRVLPKLFFNYGCWLNNLRDNNNGYKYIHIRPYRFSVHRLSYTIFNGKIPKGMSVLHKCDNRGCCNPTHLFVGTQLDNIRDMDKKGRRKVWHPTGILNPSCKLNTKDVILIRNSSLSNEILSEKYGVTTTLIRSVKMNKIWKHLK